MKYELKFNHQAAKKLIKAPKNIQKSIREKLDVLVVNPYTQELDIKKLAGVKESYRLRVRDWRVIYQIENKICIIRVIKIGNRKEIYK